MGNHQSIANPNRLTKPRTNTNSASPTPNADSPVSVSSRYADLSAKGRQQIRETLLSPIDIEFGSASWMNKDDGLGDATTEVPGQPIPVISRANSRTNSRSNSMSCFGSRHNSATKLAGPLDSKISLASTPHVDMETAIKLLQEVRKNASPEDIAALHEALESTEDHAVPVSEQGLSRKTSTINRSSSSLTKGRSLLQIPGVATRSSPVEGRRRTWNSWKAPKLDPEEEAKWRAIPKAASPLNRISALDLAEEDSNTSTPRAQTPGEMEYSHLGSLKLGSLMVTNGAPSPAPSAKVSKQNTRHTREEDYFSAVEADSSPLMMKTTKRRGHAKSKSAGLPSTAPLYSDVPMPLDDRVRTKLKHMQTHASIDDRSSDTQPETPPAKSLRIMNASPGTLNHNANRFTQGYLAELPSDPFATSNSHSPDQEGFVVEDSSFKDEAARIFDGTIFDEPEAMSETTNLVLSSTSPRIPTSNEHRNRESQRPSPRTMDSGYSSGGSLRVADQKQQSGVDAKTSTQRGGSPQTSKETREKQALKSSLSKPSVQPTSSGQTLSETAHATQAQRRPSSLKITDQSARSSARSSTSEATLSPTTPKSVASKASFDSTSSTTQKRLRRRRPSHPEPPVVQACQPIPEGTIPEVPETVRAKFVRRLSHTPGMECLTHTYPTKEHVSTAEPTSDAPPLVQTETSQLAELEPERPTTPPPQGRRRTLSFFRRKSTAENKSTEKETEDAPPSVVDLGTIAASLGTSPYDAAMSGPSRTTGTSPTHPHQLGNTLPRAKSMVSMNSQAAAELARIRSKDRSSVQQEQPRQRRRSHHNLNMEAGEAKASKRRPQSSVHDIPPVPTIDTSKIRAAHITMPAVEIEGQEVIKSDLSLSTRSRERNQIAPELTDKYDRYGRNLSQPSVELEAHSHTSRQRRKTMGDGSRSNRRFAEASASPSSSRIISQNPEDMAAWGRYSGGLSYGYEGRGVGVGGSAGTRQMHSSASSKSLHWRNQYGVDLSDVPVILRVGVGPR